MANKKMTNWEELQWRGLVKDVAGEGIEDKINNESVTFYWGTDPTADSLHLGHYSSLVTAKRLMKMGHKPILLCGGATGRIGDPRPTAEREMISIDEVNENIKCIRKQIDDLFEGKAQLVDNYDWFKDFNFLDFLREIGKYINVNYMLAKDIISRRLETGITYAEFSYTLMQGYDFLHMYQDMNCIMQVEGSDQWGNITTGVDLISKKLGKKAYAFTMPLILDENGKKFGKSEGNALWLDLDKTPSYDIYQYLFNSSDEKVEEYLKVYTFLSKEEIDELMEKHNKAPEKREAQKVLAFELIKDLHGEEEAKKARDKSEALFGGNAESLEATPSNLKIGSNVIDVLIDVQLVPSKSEARRLITQGGISINDVKVTNLDETIDEEEVLIKKGKKKILKVKLQK